MNFKNKIISITLSIIVIISSFNCSSIKIFANLNMWKLDILNILEFDELKTNEEITLYTGDAQTVVHQNEPSNKSNKYLLININVEKISNEKDIFNSSDIELNIQGKSYEQIERNFISKHGYNSFTNNDIKFGSNDGYIVFEIPKNLDYTKESKLTYKEMSVDLKISEKSIEKENTNIEQKENIIDGQWTIEKEILSDYKLGSYTIENPYIIQNPYKWAPLTALVIFETGKEAEITVKINGKDEYSAVIKNIEGFRENHQIPILGLYPDYENSVEIIAIYKDGTSDRKKLKIKTEKLPDDFIDIELIESKPEKMESGMTFLGAEGRPVIVDVNGDVRWYLEHNNYLIFKRLSNGNMLVLDERNGVNGRLGFYEIDLLGKIYNQFTDPIGVHHDVIELPNGNFLTTSSQGDHYVEDRIIELDRETGEIVNDINVREILDTKRFYNEDNNDWFHMNAIWYDENDKSIIISGAYQSIVCKISYPDGELKWILSEDDDFKNQDIRRLVLEPKGKGFKIQYGQHAPMILSDIDDNLDTIDILLYDNDSYRNYSRPDILEQNTGKYSRSVHYRIDEKNNTVEQIWEYGKERGRNYYTRSVGDSDYLSNTGNILTTFGDRSGYRDDNKLNTNISTIVETDKSNNANVVYEIDVKFNDLRRVYRSERLSLYPNELDFELGNKKGEIKFDNKDKQNIKFTNVNLEHSKKNVRMAIDRISIDNNILNISGWAIIPEYSSDEYNMSLLLRNSEDVKSTQITTMVERKDVTSGFNKELNNNINYDNSGFEISIPFKELERDLNPGKYIVGIIVESKNDKQYEETEYFFSIEDENSKLNQVEDNDLLLKQKEITDNIKEELENNNYTIDKPYIIKDPYKVSPLTALLSFNTNEKGKVSIEVKGKDDDSSVKHEFNELSKEHIIPIYGLYPDYNNTVIVTLTDESGKQIQEKINIQTDKLPEDIQKVEIKVSDKKNMKDGLTFTSSNYMSAHDSNGDIRWYLSKGIVSDNATPIKRLQNGNLALISGKQIRPMYYQTGLYEIDLLGRIHNEYIIDGIHHEIQELSNGNFIVAAEKDEKTTEDYIVEIDRKTGKVKRSWDLGEILGIEKIADETYRDRTYKDRSLMMKGAPEKDIKASANHMDKHDWFHNNAVYYIENENAILASGRMQDTIVKFDAKTKNVKWILGNPNSKWSEQTEDKLLTPVGDDFEWQYGQHAVTQLPNGDIMLYDNGNFRSKDVDKAKKPNDNYSRAVIYRVNEEDMTVEQVWQYGKERGNELYTPYIGDVDYLDENHYLLNFGGIIKDSEGNSMDSPTDLFAGSDIKGEAVIVEIKDNNIINESKLTHSFNANTYRIERLPMYYDNEGYVNLNNDAKRLGKHKVTSTSNITVSEVTDDLMFEINKLVDEGDRIIGNIDLINFNNEDYKMYIVLDNGAKKRVYNIQSGSEFIINKTDLPKTLYELSLLVVDEEGEVHYDLLDKSMNVTEGSKLKYYLELISSKLKSA